MQRFFQSHPFPILTIVVAAVAAWAVLRHPAPQGQPVTLLIAVDASGSAREGLLGPSVAAVVRLVSWLDPDSDRAFLYRVDHETTRFCGPDVPESTEALQQTLIEQMQAAAQVPGTYPANFWEQAAAEAMRAHGPVAVSFWTDGDNDDAQPQAVARIRAAAHQLAVNPHVVAVYLYGVNAKPGGVLDSEFTELGDRYRRYPATDLNIEPLRNCLEQARLQP